VLRIDSTKNRLTHPPPARRGAPSLLCCPPASRHMRVTVWMRGRACQPLLPQLPGRRTHRGAVGEAREGGGGGGEGAGGAGEGQNDSGLREHCRERNDGFVATLKKLPNTRILRRWWYAFSQGAQCIVLLFCWGGAMTRRSGGFLVLSLLLGGIVPRLLHCSMPFSSAMFSRLKVDPLHRLHA
jgi:hypothetical protein